MSNITGIKDTGKKIALQINIMILIKIIILYYAYNKKLCKV